MLNPRLLEEFQRLPPKSVARILKETMEEDPNSCDDVTQLFGKLSEIDWKLCVLISLEFAGLIQEDVNDDMQKSVVH
jgi:hypothetical protein